MTTTAAINHIEVDDKGVARIGGTRMKVIHLIQHKNANHSSAEQMQKEFPHFSLAQIHAAMAYYYDHQAELDKQIAAEEREAQALLATMPQTVGHGKLRAAGKLP
jgi:uncharacterized protein (DUF433 family)